jgi:hypothetical protein
MSELCFSPICERLILGMSSLRSGGRGPIGAFYSGTFDLNLRRMEFSTDL